MAWTLNNAPLTGAAQAQLTYRNMSPDELAVVFPGECDAAAIAAGSAVVLRDPTNRIVFRGEAILVQGDGSGATERNVLRAVGPWADLERLSWHVEDNLRLNIPEDLDGAPSVSDVSAAVRHVLAQSIALGARFSIGDIDIDGQMPAAQYDNTTCAAILIQLLRWSPGAICSWDYSGSTPRLNITRAAALPTLTLPLAGARAVNVTPRTDFRIPGVHIVYRKKVISTYGQVEAAAVDSAGSPGQLGGFIVALDLQPAQVRYSLQRTRVNVAALDPTSGAWWTKFGVPEAFGDPTSTEAEGDDLPRYIKSGQLQSWMLSSINGEANTEPHGCTGPLASSPGLPPNAGLAFGGGEPTTHIPNDQTFALGSRTLSALWGNTGYELTLPVTDLTQSGVYYRETLEAWDAGEAKPTGLASALFAAVQRLQYSGSIELVAAECDPATHHPGSRLNLSGSAWSNMGAPIHQVTHDLMSGSTRMDFGPSPVFGAADLLELFRATRPRKPDIPELDPEEEPEPIDYRANSVNRATQGAGGGDEDDDDETFAILIEVQDEDGVDFPEGSFTVAGQTYTGGGQLVTLPVEGQPHPVVFLPVTGRRTPPAASASQGGSNPTGVYRWPQEAYLEKEDQAEIWVKISTLDVANEALENTNTNTEVYLRVLDSVHMGTAGKRLVLCSEAYAVP